MSQKPSAKLIVGAIYVTLCFFFLALFSVCAKFASQTVSSFTILFFQNFICFILVLPSAIKNGLKTQHPYLHLTRDAFGFGSYLLFIISLNYIPLANAVLLSNSSPLWIPWVVWIWFRKKVPLYLWGSIFLGFVGIVLMLKPSFQSIDVPSILALVSGMLIAVSLVAIRRLSLTEPMSRILFYYFLLGGVISFPFALSELPKAFSTPVLYYLVGAALLFYLVQIFITKGLKHGNASTLSPLAYTVVLFSAIFDQIFWHIAPDFWSLIGMVLVILGGIASVYLEKRYEGKYI